MLRAFAASVAIKKTKKVRLGGGFASGRGVVNELTNLKAYDGQNCTDDRQSTAQI